jgi:hypothetical protein
VACCLHLIVEAFMNLGLVPDRPFPLTEDRGVMFPLRLDRALARKVRGGHVETDEWSTTPFPVDAHRGIRLSDGTPDTFKARPGPVPDAERAPEGSDDWSADESPARRPFSGSGNSSEDEYKAGRRSHAGIGRGDPFCERGRPSSSAGRM